MSEIVLFPLLFQYIDLATQKIALNIFFGILDLRLLTRDWTRAPCIGSTVLNIGLPEKSSIKMIFSDMWLLCLISNDFTTQ